MYFRGGPGALMHEYLQAWYLKHAHADDLDYREFELQVDDDHPCDEAAKALHKLAKGSRRCAFPYFSKCCRC